MVAAVALEFEAKFAGNQKAMLITHTQDKVEAYIQEHKHVKSMELLERACEGQHFDFCFKTVGLKMYFAHLLALYFETRLQGAKGASLPVKPPPLYLEHILNE